MTCIECKRRCFPENPSVPFYIGQGRYLRPICETCNNRFSEPDLSPILARLDILESVTAEVGSVPRQFHDSLLELRGEVRFVRNKVDELRVKRIEDHY